MNERSRTGVFSTVLAIVLALCSACGSSDDASDTVRFSGEDVVAGVCTPESCAGHGFCENGLCDCDEGFTGAHCNKCAKGFAGYPECAPDPCYPDPCAGHGYCDAGSCSCDEGFEGDHCNQCAEGYTGYPDCVSGQCAPSCEGKECGSDGCSGFCGECPAAQFCNAGQCQDDCLPDEGCTQSNLMMCLPDNHSYFLCKEAAPGCLKWTLSGNCPTGQFCLDDKCVDDPCAGVACSGIGECVADGAKPSCDCPVGYVDEELECVSAYSESTDLGVLGGQDDCTQTFNYPFAEDKTLTSTFADHVAGGRPGGLDYAASIGTPLYSPVFGTVEAVSTGAPNGPSSIGKPGAWGCSGSGFGNYVKIRIQYGEYVLLAHQNAGAISLSMGDVIVPGQKIGEVGNSGYVCSQGGNGAHLHFGYYKNGWVDPGICYAQPKSYGSPAVLGIECHDGDLDTYGIGDECWNHDCDDSEPLKQAPDSSGCGCLADTGDGIDCKDRDGDGYKAGKNCPFYDQDCNDFDKLVHDLCADKCEGQACPSNCNNHGSCNGGVCSCNQGYKGISCNECADGYVGYPDCHIDGCEGNPCNSHGECINGYCSCDPGFSGSWCNQCAPGYVGYPDCHKDDCAGDPCNGHGFCSNGECDCYNGYDGSSCNKCDSGYSGYPNCQPEQQDSCPSGNGLYCGGPVGLDSKTLYNCKDGNYSSYHLCGDGCHVADPGFNDYCNPCPSGNGLYCGGPFGLDSDTLYFCSGGNFTVNKECPGSCHVAAPGQNDYCN